MDLQQLIEQFNDKWNLPTKTGKVPVIEVGHYVLMFHVASKDTVILFKEFNVFSVPDSKKERFLRQLLTVSGGVVRKRTEVLSLTNDNFFCLHKFIPTATLTIFDFEKHIEDFCNSLDFWGNCLRRINDDI